MLYGIVYVFRLSDFLAIAKGHGAKRIFLTSVWVKETHAENPECLSDGYFKWTDVHELSFMGAFGMCYKMLIDGQTQDGKTAENHLLWTHVGLLTTHVQACCARGGKDCPQALTVTAGTVVGTEIHQQARVSWTLFMSDKIPRKVPVCNVTTKKSEGS